MKKIGIITIHNSPNYGASLQAYALYQYIVSKGLDCEIIDLHRPYQDDYIRSKRYVPYSDLYFRMYAAPFKRFKSTVKHLLNFIFKRREKREHLYFSTEAKKKFDAFNGQIRMSKPYFGIDQLYAKPPLYDVYISGSDQLWNPSQPYCLDPYFLTFVKNKNAKKISFATSIGIEYLTDFEKTNFKKALEQYDSISVREVNAQQLLKSFIDKPAIYQVADPTFLLDADFWKSLCNNPLDLKNYILLFMLGFNLSLIEYAKTIAKESGKQLIVLCQKQPEAVDNSYIAVTDAGPREFLGYINDADMVLTDSFHGTVFSIILGSKNFYTYIAPENKRSSRIKNLLSSYKLQDHILDVSLNQTFNDLEQNSIDFCEVSSIMNKERDRSRLFLDTNLDS